MNEGARRGSFYHDTGEGSISPYHLENGGDLVWEIGSGYFGCRDDEGRFRRGQIRGGRARDAQVRMIEIKLSQGAKPGHGGVLPAAKVSAEIAATRGVPMGVDCVSPAQAFRVLHARAVCCEFVARLRELSGGKPTGFKLAIGHPWEWFGIAKAMHETGLLPDFIVVDGAEGGTGAAPAEFIDHVGVPMHEALMLVHNTLVGLDLRDKIRIGAAGPHRQRVRHRAHDGDGRGLVQRRRAVSCSRWAASSRCRATPTSCPTGVATQDPRRWQATRRGRQGHARAPLPPEHAACACATCCARRAWSIRGQLGPEHILRRVSPIEVRSLAALYRFLAPGELLGGMPDHAVFQQFWAGARSDSFAPPDKVASLRGNKSM